MNNKKSYSISALLMTALMGLSFTACSTDVEHDIPGVGSPTFVGVSPENNIKAGLDSILVTYDNKVFFASSDFSKITLNGQPVVSANVIGSSNTLLIMANIERDTEYELVIPEGVVTGPNQMPAAEVKVTLNAQAQNIAPQLVNANATAATKALYQKLVDNYGKKTFSAAMADVAWNNVNAEKVHTLTGKYPAINCYDYIHLNSTTTGGWIDYGNITPAKSWHDAGGIVAAGWHWSVPTSNPYADKVPVAVYDGAPVDIPSDWSGSLQLTDQKYLDILANASIGSTLTVKISNVAAGAQGSIKNSSWAGIVDELGTSYEYFDISGDSYSLVLDEVTLNVLKSGGLILSGHDYTITGVTVEAAGTVNYNFYAEKNDFKLDNAVTEGTWEYKYAQSDLEKISAYLLQLQSAGIPVLWRPLHEASGKWFWWGNGSAESYKTLWQTMYKYFKDKGINNLIWVWTSVDNDDSWYPGDEYVDIIGTDIYGTDGTSGTEEAIKARFNNLAYRHPTKMITLSECGTVAEIPSQWNAGAQWSWFMPWYDVDGATSLHATDAWWKAAMSNSNVITREDL